MWSKALTYKLKPGFYPEYKKAHDELWPELAQAMADNQVNMVIHHHQERLYLYMTAPTEEHFTCSHTGEVADRYMQYIASMMITDDRGKTIMEEMDMSFPSAATRKSLRSKSGFSRFICDSRDSELQRHHRQGGQPGSV